jgi:hypothetical protein
MTSPKWFPQMRLELEDALAALADPGRQDRWREGDPESGCLDYAIHFLFDDTELSTDATSCIGWFLKDETEVLLLKPVIQALSAMIDRLGDQTDCVYLDDPEWPNVVALAQIALTYFES